MAVPLVAIAFGAGMLACHDLARRRRLPWLVPLCLAGVLAYNVAWLWVAAYSIRQSDPAAFATRLIAYMAGQPERKFWLSPGAVSLFDLGPPRRIECAPDRGQSASASARDAVVFLAGEGNFAWVFNRPWFYELTIGSHEINYVYYPGWFGRHYDHRIVVVSADRARKRLANFEEFQHCRPRQ
jgi:hypothetical protein